MGVVVPEVGVSWGLNSKGLNSEGLNLKGLNSSLSKPPRSLVLSTVGVSLCLALSAILEKLETSLLATIGLVFQPHLSDWCYRARSLRDDSLPSA